MVTPFATTADYETFTGKSLPDGMAAGEATALLNRASTQVRSYLPAGYTPSDDDTDALEALRDATCAQAAWWLANDDDGDPTGASGQYDSVKIGTVDLEKSTSQAQGSSGTAKVQDTRMSAEAIQILQIAGLLTSRVAHW